MVDEDGRVSVRMVEDRRGLTSVVEFGVGKVVGVSSGLMRVMTLWEHDQALSMILSLGASCLSLSPLRLILVDLGEMIRLIQMIRLRSLR